MCRLWMRRASTARSITGVALPAAWARAARSASTASTSVRRPSVRSRVVCSRCDGLSQPLRCSVAVVAVPQVVSPGPVRWPAAKTGERVALVGRSERSGRHLGTGPVLRRAARAPAWTATQRRRTRSLSVRGRGASAPAIHIRHRRSHGASNPAVSGFRRALEEGAGQSRLSDESRTIRDRDRGRPSVNLKSSRVRRIRPSSWRHAPATSRPS
jgi:hypothetical protein